MPGFYYFTNRGGGIGQFTEAGLAYAFDGPPAMTEVGAAVGPGGLPGMIYHAADDATGIPTGIQWTKISAAWWMGMHPQNVPTPEDLRRRGYEISNGGMVEMGDRRQWLIPLILPCTDIDPNRRPGLPFVYRLFTGIEFTDQETVPRFMAPGQPVAMQLEPEFQRLVDKSGPFMDFILEEDAPSPSTSDICNFVIGLLSVGHRVRLAECEALGLITSKSATQAVQVALDWAERLRAQLSEDERAWMDSGEIEVKAE